MLRAAASLEGVQLLTLLGVLFTTACRAGYPLEPTPCDDWCDAVSRVRCNGQDPANCVLGCEESGVVPDAPECQAAWQTALACYRSLPEPSGDCVDDPVIPESSEEVPCQFAYDELMNCHGRPEGGQALGALQSLVGATGEL